MSRGFTLAETEENDGKPPGFFPQVNKKYKIQKVNCNIFSWQLAL